jgi:uncharacterized protein
MPADDAVAGPPAVTVPTRVALTLIRVYQLAFSPMFAGSCRFHPSCSAYAAEAVARHGVVRGTLLAVRRLARCRPLAKHGFDPVPDCTPARTGGRRDDRMTAVDLPH